MKNSKNYSNANFSGFFLGFVREFWVFLIHVASLFSSLCTHTHTHRTKRCNLRFFDYWCIIFAQLLFLCGCLFWFGFLKKFVSFFSSFIIISSAHSCSAAFQRNTKIQRKNFWWIFLITDILLKNVCVFSFLFFILSLFASSY